MQTLPTLRISKLHVLFAYYLSKNQQIVVHHAYW
jgi:hypothetical protein